MFSRSSWVIDLFEYIVTSFIFIPVFVSSHTENYTVTITDLGELYIWSIISSHLSSVQFSSVQSLSHVWLFETPWTAARRAPCPSPSPRLKLMSIKSIKMVCHQSISFSVVPCSSRLQPFPASGSFQMSQYFTSGGQSTGVSASTSVLPMIIQDWFPLGWTSWISLLSKELS